MQIPANRLELALATGKMPIGLLTGSAAALRMRLP